ncbi:glycosyltransferase [Vibrio alginolyticus]
MTERVTVVIPCMNQGGTAKAALAHARSIDAFCEKIEVNLVVCKGKETSDVNLNNHPKLPCSYLGLTSFFNVLKLLICAFKFGRAHNGIVLAMHFDAVFFCFLAKILGGQFRLYCQFHTDLKNYIDTQRSYRKFLFNLFLKQLIVFDGVIFLTKEQKKWFSYSRYAKYINYNCSAIPNPINFSKSCPVTSDKDRLLFVGRLSEEKNIAFLIDSYALYLDAGGELPLDICGEGPLIGELKKKVRLQGLTDKIQFHGYVTDLSSYYASAKVLILASHVEGFPLVLLEGVHYQANILTSNCSSACYEMFNIQENFSQKSYIGRCFSVVDISTESTVGFSSQLYRLSYQDNMTQDESDFLLSKYSNEVIGRAWFEVFEKGHC